MVSLGVGRSQSRVIGNGVGEVWGGKLATSGRNSPERRVQAKKTAGLVGCGMAVKGRRKFNCLAVPYNRLILLAREESSNIIWGSDLPRRTFCHFSMNGSHVWGRGNHLLAARRLLVIS